MRIAFDSTQLRACQNLTPINWFRSDLLRVIVAWCCCRCEMTILVLWVDCLISLFSCSLREFREVHSTHSELIIYISWFYLWNLIHPVHILGGYPLQMLIQWKVFASTTREMDWYQLFTCSLYLSPKSDLCQIYRSWKGEVEFLGGGESLFPLQSEIAFDAW